MKINIYGNGAEIVIGKLSEKQTDKIFPLLSKKDDGIDEAEFETIMEKNSSTKFSVICFENPTCIYIKFTRSFLVKLILIN